MLVPDQSFRKTSAFAARISALRRKGSWAIISRGGAGKYQCLATIRYRGSSQLFHYTSLHFESDDGYAEESQLAEMCYQPSPISISVSSSSLATVFYSCRGRRAWRTGNHCPDDPLIPRGPDGTATYMQIARGRKRKLSERAAAALDDSDSNGPPTPKPKKAAGQKAVPTAAAISAPSSSKSHSKSSISRASAPKPPNEKSKQKLHIETDENSDGDAPHCPAKSPNILSVLSRMGRVFL
ncbi:hypothetical protein B0H13DRAFT_1872084 [Mycena leptocephala]|nr:hypothetical protein B0H13DRAFT_1872084 [Mycena leptocephala]